MSEPFNDIEQVEMAVKAAERMVGQATMSMDEEQLQNADQALTDAKEMLEFAKQHEIEGEVRAYSEDMINRLDHQLHEAKQ
ncbi:DUF2564 family protein [Texcoconibacillus texcoconensis]|uniref:D-arabinose 1-dehydrogenase-like Zn-dependent alcohol dehydrogenase n=1 Tax=Texcoconibacillus texcoconensis TaxID=1095777 RepID=A0A840QT47_9BACI|nr:DUF2564 family protein [Texcoconibacillus texcoconensis]MBB5174520.1 D-arabinose 1-dehydrogenase-like Zn-dependent alcohol dehydrogenase [Texcoconibacillus texcoconensis]